MAEKFKLPDNSVRIMCASGIAAGIAATFNAPLAAVVFVLEVVLREYKVQYFFPIMLSAICGAVSSQVAFGNIHEFDAIKVSHIPLDQYPLLALGGIVLGVAAALFNHSLIQVTERGQHWPLIVRLLLAGVITTLIGLVLPQALGSGEMAIGLRSATTRPSGFCWRYCWPRLLLPLPPSALGSGWHHRSTLRHRRLGRRHSGSGDRVAVSLGGPLCRLYTVIGMTAMMGVCLSAPLAALVALLEMTNDASIILPGMIVAVPAYLIAYQG